MPAIPTQHPLLEYITLHSTSGNWEDDPITRIEVGGGVVGVERRELALGELRVFVLSSLGLTDQQVADATVRSKGTIKTQLHDIRKKLGSPMVRAVASAFEPERCIYTVESRIDIDRVPLSRTELMIANRQAHGDRQDLIARSMYISTNTVKTYLQHMYSL